MHPTDPNPEASFFADWLLPLRRAHMRLGVDYLRRDAEAETLWGPVVSRSGGVARIAPEATGAQSLLAALDDYWSQAHDTSLRQLSPGLLKLLLAAPSGPADAREDAVVAEFVYPLF